MKQAEKITYNETMQTHKNNHFSGLEAFGDETKNNSELLDDKNGAFATVKNSSSTLMF